MRRTYSNSRCSGWRRSTCDWLAPAMRSTNAPGRPPGTISQPSPPAPSTPAPYDAAVLSASDPLPRRPERIAVAGVSGSGKSTLARRIGALLDLPYTEMDALHHGPGWTRRPEFEADVAGFLAVGRWVTEWQYDDARPLLTAQADLLVWLDPPFPVTLGRVVRRTVGRRWRREELWNGNREAPLHTVLTDREHIVRWAISTRHLYDERIPAVCAARPDLPVVHLRHRRDVERWLDGVLAPLA